MPPLRERGTDIILLFRLFAMQMAEKYHLPKITLTDDAKPLLMKYKWPGNVRQLKNITEQMSVLSPKREIDPQTLLQYIPADQEESTQLVAIGTKGSHSYESEREILYKILYELRGNVSDLRREMNSLRKQLDEARSMQPSEESRQLSAVDNTYPVVGNSSAITAAHPVYPRQPRVEDAVAEEISDPETLNLNERGRQMVEKALERNGGNRKKAAQELGISDRTLFRRLKQYGLNKNS